MHVSAAHQGSEPVVNQEESNGKLPPCVHCQESDNGSLSSPRVVLDLMVPSNIKTLSPLPASLRHALINRLTLSTNNLGHTVTVDQIPFTISKY